MLKLSELLEERHILLGMDATDIEDAYDLIVNHLVKSGYLKKKESEEIKSALIEREHDNPTAIGKGVAAPHTYSKKISGQILLIVRLNKGIKYVAPDNQAVDVIFLLAGPKKAEKKHLMVLARIARLLHDEKWLADMRTAKSAEHIIRAVLEVEIRHV